ncbi:long-chain fatty acid--CoA ligase [Skermania sp. ID1734]|uniref:class I adenylate-forming enzyme family protein n=1 Tax=Skermania sp. ID1734 TaxID=2597516 RepID=UPI00118042CB|nr:AMP-binding protein [Skermania sp. ID1734]TSD94109.1 long-chain fatty acid--CoA ligase [Skermania sp. ID1734]
MTSTELVPLGQMYASTFENFADRPAVRDDREELTYAELGGRVRRLASALRGLGLTKGDRVIIISPNSVEWAQIERAVAIGGFVRVALLTRLHPAELAQIAADADPAVVFADADWLKTKGRDWIPPQVRGVVAMGPAAVPDGATRFDEFVATGRDEEAQLPEGEDLAAVLYTSGSTGLPKGVKLTHNNAGARIRGIRNELPSLGAEDVAVHTAPISHFSGGINEVVAAAGGLNMYEAAFKAPKVADLAESGQITVLPLVPTMITMLLEELERRGAPTGQVGNVKIVPYAGSAIQPDRAEKARAYFGDAMQQLYGASEAQMPIAALSPKDHVTVKNNRGLPRLASAGKPTTFVEVAIVDENHQPLPHGETGEIATRGAHVGPGYWRNDPATAEAFRDGWCYTGDVGYIDEFGYLFILDRRKDMIITGGFNVYPREIENVVSRIPGVREVAVLGAPDEKWGEAITAVISLVSGCDLAADAVIDYCREHLGGYKVPKRVIIIDELPKGGTGKINKVELRDKLWAGRERRV